MSGPGVDRSGNEVADPTLNVKELNEAGLKAQDGLRRASVKHLREQMSGLQREMELRSKYEKKIADLRALHYTELQEKESARLDAQHTDDQARLVAEATASEIRATALQAQVALSADAVRTTQAAATQAQAENLTRVITPLQASIDSLRQAQSERIGEKQQVVQARDAAADNKPVLDAIAALVKAQSERVGANTSYSSIRDRQQWNMSTAILIIGIILSLFVGIGGLIVGTGTLSTPTKDVTVLPNCSVAPVGAPCTAIK